MNHPKTEAPSMAEFFLRRRVLFCFSADGKGGKLEPKYRIAAALGIIALVFLISGIVKLQY
jgi:hypothetical protein